MTSSSSPSSNPCCGSGSVNHRLAASLLGSGGRPPLPSPTPPPAAASEAVAATSSRGFEDGDGSRRFCAGILAFCPWDLGSRIAARARGRWFTTLPRRWGLGGRGGGVARRGGCGGGGRGSIWSEVGGGQVDARAWKGCGLRREEEIGRGSRVARGVRLVVGLHRRFGSI
jgi:hypothetical protein